MSTAIIHVEVLYAANHLNAVRLVEAGRHCSVVQEYLVDRKFQVGGAFRCTRAPLLPADDLHRATVDAVVGICVKRREHIAMGIRTTHVERHSSCGNRGDGMRQDMRTNVFYETTETRKHLQWV